MPFTDIELKNDQSAVLRGIPMNMKSCKTLRVLALVLILSILLPCMPALAASYSAAVTGKQGLLVFTDAGMKNAAGTLPRYTVFTVKAINEQDVAKIEYEGKIFYCEVDNGMTAVKDFATPATVSQNARVYEEADTDSRSSTLKKGTELNVLAVKGSWAMVEKDGNVGYVKADDLDIEGESVSKEDKEDLPDDEAFEEAVKEQVKEEEKKPEKKMSVKEIFASGKYTNEQLCYAFAIKELGYNNAAAAGLLANIKAESNFRTNANGDSGRSYGICQWFSARKTRLVNWCSLKKLDPATLYGQLYFLKYELETYYPSVHRYMKNVENTPEGAYDAAYYFCYNFEAPANKASKSTSRGNSAQDTYYDKYIDVVL